MSNMNSHKYYTSMSRDLRKMALEATQEAVGTSTSAESVNEALVRVLYKGEEKLTRIELRARLKLDRLIAVHTEPALEVMNDKDFLELLDEVDTTVKNGLDTSLSKSNNNSAFWYNPKYKNLKLELVAGKYQITKVKVKA